MKKISGTNLYGAFTLIELLVAIFIVAVFLLMTVPAFNSLFDNNSDAVVLNNLHYALAYVQNAAVKYGIDVKLCGSLDHKTCTDNWRYGQIAVTADHRLLRVFPRIPDNRSLSLKSGLSKQTYVEYTPLGTINGQASSLYYGKRDDSSWIWRIIVSIDGNLRVEKQGKSFWLR